MTRHSEGNNTIKDWATADRPREKMLEKGREALSDAELMAILLGSGNKKETAVDLSRRILRDVDNNLVNLSGLSISDLMQYNGIGEAKAIAVMAALELGRRRRIADVVKTEPINNSKKAFEYFNAKMADLTHEEFWILLLNADFELIKLERVAIGGLNNTSADPKIIFKTAIENNATALMLAHNHPSGNTEPSPTDINLTDELIKGGKVLHINVLDHLIIGKNDYYSMAENFKI